MLLVAACAGDDLGDVADPVPRTWSCTCEDGASWSACATRDEIDEVLEARPSPCRCEPGWPCLPK